MAEAPTNVEHDLGACSASQKNVNITEDSKEVEYVNVPSVVSIVRKSSVEIVSHGNDQLTVDIAGHQNTDSEENQSGETVKNAEELTETNLNGETKEISIEKNGNVEIVMEETIAEPKFSTTQKVMFLHWDSCRSFLFVLFLLLFFSWIGLYCAYVRGNLDGFIDWVKKTLNIYK